MKSLERDQIIEATVKRYIPMPKEDMEVVKSIFSKPKIIKAKTTLVEVEQYAKYCWIILSGSARFYYNVNGKEVTGNLFTENMFLTSHDSFLKQVPSRYAVQTVEECELVELHIDTLRKALIQAPSIQMLINGILIERLTIAHNTISRLITMNPEERYQCIIDENPEWIARIPSKILASYLGISANSLSRIKKRLHS